MGSKSPDIPLSNIPSSPPFTPSRNLTEPPRSSSSHQTPLPDLAHRRRLLRPNRPLGAGPTRTRWIER
ncbi:hypothetical protein SODALDRAFT_331082 [Sodiomyces alkalinus F11]|uniref:Uncharacterized protein n=1 Tax=Sodiomyces alkalinus (strain CBS 110278 / VKM F-3762 / F11) TaxID=1314773 RepID=A0A3N2Q3M0_SODAK|nr:hypothetical protein SODALDRAFT_331082 [Sodiomyces alkalinus F11]ROT41359.1 hypothetical protein SODALDRAFT_331082 [Sodiomyces alkalinus F11]